MDPTREHLRLLSIFHYVVGGLGFLVSLFPGIYLAFGILMLAAPVESMTEPPSDAETESLQEWFEVQPPDRANGEISQSDIVIVRSMGGMFVAISALLMIGGFALSTAIIIAGKRLAAYRSHTYCVVIAAILCVFMPLGTALGVFTLIVLLRPEARDLFAFSGSPKTPLPS